ncbi:kinase modulator [Lithospermum erythrorhizon]|uniref:Kinase modulator n=1 Tax=Lithospermum erythrorhizon TaxID=34254 RepID=A0AAV3QAT0_LITER
MYPAGMNYGRESVGLLPVRFVWSHGGRSVYLCASFTGWAQWPMAPVEGCPTVFQTVCSLPPGYHQYKFIVDGEWKHDENQPFVNSNYGTVNTLLLANEPDYVPTMLTAQVPPVASMDVDNDTFQRAVRDCQSQLVRVSDGSVHEAFPRITEAELQSSRLRISGFLSSHAAYELLPESGKAIALDVELPVKQAFHILHEQGIPTSPLWDFSRGQFVGVLSALDFILIMRELGSHGSNLTEEQLETHTISAWKEAKSYAERQMLNHGTVPTKRLVHAGPDENLKDVALKILHNRVATVPIINSSTEDGLYPQLLHVASLSGILRSMCRYFKHSLASLPILQLPICVIPLGTWVPKIGEANRQPLAMLRPSASLGAALNLFLQAQVSSIPIVDDNDSLLDIYSRSDITSLAKGKMYTHVKLEEMTIHHALQLGEEPSSSYGFGNQRCHMCLRSDPLYKVMERLSRPGVRRLVIVEAGSKRVEGIVSLSDVFRFLLG